MLQKTYFCLTYKAINKTYKDKINLKNVTPKYFYANCILKYKVIILNEKKLRTSYAGQNEVIIAF